MNSPLLDLPYLTASQAQKHVTHNEALRMLDGIVQLRVVNATEAAPPASPSEGDRYIVAAGATGSWAGWDNSVAMYVDGAWLRLPPGFGWRAWNAATQELWVWTGSSWETLDAAMGLLKTTNVQASATDTTAGALMAVGAWGLGAVTAPEITDFTAELRPGLYMYVENTATGAPGGSAYYGSAIVLRPSDSNARVTVIASRATTNPANQRTWIGQRNTGTGTIEWTEIYTQSRIVGTVSQSAGIPTGAVIEYGSNGNGEYVRFADGTQICMSTVETSLTAGVTWTFPASFAAVPRAYGGANSASAALVTFSNQSTTSYDVHGWDTTGSRDQFFARVMTIGRWY
ncbi:MAG: DUF2793 domain-containing protein [Paracoccaceae bacterium]